MDIVNFIDDTPASVKLCRKTYNGSLECEEYLFQRDYESDKSYEGRLKFVSVGHNFKKNIDGIISMIFKDKIGYTDIPEDIQEEYKLINGTDSINFFARETLRSVLLEHTAYVLVWTPENKARNKAEEKALRIRPYAENISRFRIVGKYTQRDATGALTQLCVRGSYEEQDKDDHHLMITKPEYRFYHSDGRVEIYRESEGGFKLYDTLQNELRVMPIVEFSFDINKEKVPPFYDPALYQLQIMNIESGKDRYNFDLPFALAVTYGMLQNSKNLKQVDPVTGVAKVEFRSDRGIDFPVNPETGARLGGVEFVERKGDIDNILARTIEDKRQSINESFISLVSDSLTGNKTKEQSESERAMGISSLTAISLMMKEGLNQMHSLFLQNRGIKGKKGELYLDLDFLSKELSKEMLDLFNGLYIDGVLSDKDYIRCLQDPEYFETLDAEELAIAKRDMGI